MTTRRTDASFIRVRSTCVVANRNRSNVRSKRACCRRHGPSSPPGPRVHDEPVVQIRPLVPVQHLLLALLRRGHAHADGERRPLRAVPRRIRCSARRRRRRTRRRPTPSTPNPPSPPPAPRPRPPRTRPTPCFSALYASISSLNASKEDNVMSRSNASPSSSPVPSLFASISANSAMSEALHGGAQARLHRVLQRARVLVEQRRVLELVLLRVLEDVAVSSQERGLRRGERPRTRAAPRARRRWRRTWPSPRPRDPRS